MSKRVVITAAILSSCMGAQAQDALYPFDITTSLSLRGGYEDKNGVGQNYFLATPEIAITRADGDLTLSGQASASIDKYQAEQGGVRALNLGADATYQLGKRTALGGSFSYQLDLPRVNADGLADDVATAPLSQNLSVGGQIGHQFNKTGIEARLGIGRSQTGNSVLTDDSIVDNRDQNSWAVTAGGRVTRELTPIVDVFVDGAVTRSIYDQASAILGAKRDGWTFDNRVGVSANFNNRLTGEISLGQLRRTYDDGSFNGVLTTSYGAAITYLTSNTSSVELTADTTLDPASVPGDPTKITDQVSISFSQQINDRFAYRLSADMGREHYQDSAREAQTFGIGVEGTYVINSYSSAFAGYRYSMREDSGEGGHRTNMIEAGLRFTRP